MSEPRFLVGIDLGTTHTVVAYADIRDGLNAAEPKLFLIPQLIAPGEVAELPLLASMRYHPVEGELTDADLTLPWPKTDLPGELAQVVMGALARERAAKVDGRSVISAKSWLCHDKVDRSAAILPWAAAEDVAKVSPVLASASYLAHVRAAWNHAHPNDPLEQQDVVITVPASFDEAARSLTVDAARVAGLPSIRLLEEPQAVCYDWYARHRADGPQQLANSKLLLVVDIGGGTTDLSLIKIRVENGELNLTRVGVGEHLMLGGDNIDLALARQAELALLNPGQRFNAGALAQLIGQCRT
ncbi:MAG TPA: Hsp70 family protein, partial [Pseudomonadales bacterium]|nr:Hsp70 family protein [Pseudomonadales bacterium]